MKPQNYFWLIGLTVILFSSCNNGDDEPDPVSSGGGTLTLTGDEAHYTSNKLDRKSVV